MGHFTKVVEMDMKLNVQFRVFLCIGLFSLCRLVEGFDIRLWPVNERGNEGFVEVFFNNKWGFVGNPAQNFDDATSSFLCRQLGLSQFGYSSGWTSIDNYDGDSWLHNLVCTGHETDIEQCIRSDWTGYNYGNKTDWAYRHGTRLFCTDSRIIKGEIHNRGMVQTVVKGNTYALCYDDFDMNAANVLCNNLGYDGAWEIYSGEVGTSTILPGTLSCKGCEYSLSECAVQMKESSTCSAAAYVTCKAVRMPRMSQYVDEGPVEIYYNGSWGLVGNPEFTFDDATARYLCKRFEFGDVGFSTTAHSLATYNRHAWMYRFICNGTETSVMQCSHSDFAATPVVRYTYRVGTWLYCFDFNISSVRLVGGASESEGKVELLIKGRWGSICTFGMNNAYNEKAGRVLCHQMGYKYLEKVFIDNNQGHSDDLIWMSEVVCSGTESSITECHHFRKGRTYNCVNSPVFLKIRCTEMCITKVMKPIETYAELVDSYGTEYEH